MELKQYLENLYDYNYWANKHYLAVAERLTEEQLFRKQGHSWDSIHAVLVHMMSSERMWPQRWRGETGTFLDPKDFATIASVREYWLDVEKNMLAFLAEQREESLLREITALTRPGSGLNFCGIDSQFLRPMITTWPIVVCLKNCISAGKCQSRSLFLPISPFLPFATISLIMVRKKIKQKLRL